MTQIDDECQTAGYNLARGGCTLEFAKEFGPQHALGWHFYHCCHHNNAAASKAVKHSKPFLHGMDLALFECPLTDAEAFGPETVAGWRAWHAEQSLTSSFEHVAWWDSSNEEKDREVLAEQALAFRAGFVLARASAPRDAVGVYGEARGAGWDAYHAVNKIAVKELTQEQCEDYLEGISRAAWGVPRNHALLNTAHRIGWDAYQNSDGAIDNLRYREGFRKACEGLRAEHVINRHEDFIYGWSDYPVVKEKILSGLDDSDYRRIKIARKKYGRVSATEFTPAVYPTISAALRAAARVYEDARKDECSSADSAFTPAMRDKLRAALRTAYRIGSDGGRRSADTSTPAIDERLSSLLSRTEQSLGPQSEQQP